MNHLEYKKLEKTTLETKNVDAICYLLDVGAKIVNSRINSYKYTYSDLNEEDWKQIYKLNKLNNDDVLIGGEIHRIVGDVETKQLVLRKADEIEFFTLLEQISLIKANLQNLDKMNKILENFNKAQNSKSTISLFLGGSLPSLDTATEVAFRISEEAITPPLDSKEQALFISGFQECIKWLNLVLMLFIICYV